MYLSKYGLLVYLKVISRLLTIKLTIYFFYFQIQNDFFSSHRSKRKNQLKIVIERHLVAAHQRQPNGSEEHTPTDSVVEGFQTSQPHDADQMLSVQKRSNIVQT